MGGWGQRGLGSEGVRVGGVGGLGSGGWGWGRGGGVIEG